MDDSNNASLEGLEDQVRRMILSNGSSQPQPTVRLPPSQSSYPRQQPTVHHPASSRPFVSPQAQHGSSTTYSNGQAGPVLQDQNFPFHAAQRGPGSQSVRQKGQQSHQDFHRRFAPNSDLSPHQRARFQQHMPLDPDAFRRRGFQQPHNRQQSSPQQLYNPDAPRGPPRSFGGEQQARQAEHLEQLALREVRNVDMSASEHEEKHAFRHALQRVCHEVCDADPGRLPQISLECFGSFQSGLATAGSDMDLVIVVQNHVSASTCFSLLEGDLPRALEQRLLELGYGARLLTRTRVPIIKVCEKPGADFLEKLRVERESWNNLPDEKKYPHLYPEEAINGHAEELADDSIPAAVHASDSAMINIHNHNQGQHPHHQSSNPGMMNSVSVTNGKPQAHGLSNSGLAHTTDGANERNADGRKPHTKNPNTKMWTRERKAGALDFPKSGVGIQSDINFFNPLGLHNTQLLRCYSLCDTRVRPMVIFVKAWAKRRKINSSYSGTLSSYGFVLMVLHYLVNVVHPPVLPNLQQSFRPSQGDPGGNTVDDWNVDFWRKEDEITDAAQRGQLTANRESLGSLLAGFFRYYSSQGGGVTFRWMGEVLSLRTVGGLLTKEEKGWVKAMTEEGEGKKIQHRYLFCIEDPFELSHNVARTVTHNGIVAIRDEFRRAMRILYAVGNGMVPKDGELFAILVEAEDVASPVEVLKRSETQASHTNGHVQHGVDSALPSPNNTANQQPGTSDQQRRNTPRSMKQQVHARKQDAQRAASTASSPKAQGLNFADNSAFPALGGAKPSKKGSRGGDQGGNFSEISGDQARVFLEEVKRKKDEQHAESTATGAAEAVLGDSD